jgi:biopolymer transport protein ExbD
MRVPSNLARGSLSFNMTPMIDVVFLLIIFFLVASHLASQEVQAELDLPQAASGQRPADDRTRRMTVNVLADGRVLVAGKTMQQNDLIDAIDYESRRTDGHVEVRIRCDRKVPYRIVEPIMVACATEGVWKVTFAVVSRQ